MVVVGGITRLTRSGLSITEWKPILGALPPLGEAQWLAEFHRYQASPEYLQVNRGMGLEAFKQIYYVEWFHRLLGRLIGVVFFVPMIYFLVRRQVSRTLAPRLVLLFGLGSLQGALGWFMVKSGLVNEPRVSQYRLTAHLGAALLIYAYLLWLGWDLRYGEGREGRSLRSPRSHCAAAVAGLVFVMAMSGGFVAGLRAGWGFNTFPLMAGGFFPPGMFDLDPWYRNFFENRATVQFDHRLIAYVLALVVPAFGIWMVRQPINLRARRAVFLLMAMLAVQVTLGILTLVLVIPTPLAVAHQAGALLLFTLALFVWHQVRPAGETAEAT